MTLYGFRDKRTAENLKQFGETLRFNRTPTVVRSTGSETVTAKIAEEIAAVDGTGKRSSGTAVVVQFDGAGDKGEINTEITVFNSTSEVLAVDDQVQVVKEGAKWTTVAGGSGGGGGSTNYVIVANSGITAATWATAGSGTGDIWELASGGGSWSAVGGSSVDIRNPWEETIASGSRMICYKDGDYYVVIQASCPSV